MSNFIIGLACALAGLIGVAIGFLVFGESEVLLGIQALGSLAVACSAVVAYRLYLASTNRHVQEDERNQSGVFLEEAKQILERAYEIFSSSGELAPANDRLLWLSIARMLLRYQALKVHVTEPDHQQILEENEEFQRLRFYLLLDRSKDEFDRAYFQGPTDHPKDGEEIDDRSIAVIFHFTRWPADRPDPIDNVDDVELFAQGAVPINYLGVEAHLSRRQEHWEAIQTRKEQLRNERT
ncbi:hypothetical protein [Chromohalobacter israelensis]|uniref:hypothetical protein n=1 Tax=Chromohalobacter israelensis TaxID=141390 RepID=UPI000FFE9E90|nr:hypothetical protein [Chromohalobacter salexigens]